ncbi:trypsin-like peptidase domain-containing protein [Actinoplanes sp. URMC 104]
MTYEPFTPAGSGEQRRYDGRRRADERPADGGGRWNEPAADPWGEPAADPWGQQQWVEDPRWAGEQGWADDQHAGAGRRGASDQRAEAGRLGVEDRRPGEQRWEQAAPVPQQRHRGWAPAAQPGEQPSWHADVAPRTAEPGPLPQRAPAGRRKPLVIGLVVLLALVAGWQAYRIEGMSRHNQDLASVLSAEQTRTDRLEKQLAGMFDPEGVSSGVLPSVFRVRAGGFTGTAFSVGKAPGNQANLVTNYHVVAETWTGGGRRVSLERGSTRITATIVKVDKGKDLALLRAGQRIAGLQASTAQVKPGQQVVVVGAPLGLDDSVTTGVISAYRPDDADGPTIQFDAPINPGNSGGPVVNANEQVVGVATAKAKDAEGIGLAIPIRTACDALKVC